MPFKYILIKDLYKFDIKNLTISKPKMNKKNMLTAQLTYTDPETGNSGIPKFLVKGRWRAAFKPSDYQNNKQYKIEFDSQINSMNPKQSSPDGYHSQFYNIIRAIDDFLLEEAKKDPGSYLGDEDPSEKDYLKKRFSAILPSKSKKDGSAVKTVDGKYNDNIKLKLPFNIETNTFGTQFFLERKGQKFDANDPSCSITMEDIAPNDECSFVVESAGVWFPKETYGHSMRAVAIKKFETDNISAKDAANALEDSDGEEEEEEVPRHVEEDANALDESDEELS